MTTTTTTTVTAPTTETPSLISLVEAAFDRVAALADLCTAPHEMESLARAALLFDKTVEAHRAYGNPARIRAGQALMRALGRIAPKGAADYGDGAQHEADYIVVLTALRWEKPADGAPPVKR